MHEHWFASTAALMHPERCIPQFELISYPLILLKLIVLIGWRNYAFVNCIHTIRRIVLVLLFAVDWILLEFLSLRVGAGGHMRYILKKILGLMPLYGFMVHRHGGIFVRQGGLKDAEEIRRKLKQMADLKQPVSGRGRLCGGLGMSCTVCCWCFNGFCQGSELSDLQLEHM